MTAPELLTPAEVRALFRVSPQAVACWARAGKLAAVALPNGRDRRYFKAEVDAMRAGAPLTPEQVQALRAQLGGTA